MNELSEEERINKLNKLKTQAKAGNWIIIIVMISVTIIQDGIQNVPAIFYFGLAALSWIIGRPINKKIKKLENKNK